MTQKAVMKVLIMTDDKSKQKAVHAACDVYGVDSVEVDMNEQTLTVIGSMDVVAVNGNGQTQKQAQAHIAESSQPKPIASVCRQAESNGLHGTVPARLDLQLHNRFDSLRLCAVTS